MRKVSAETEQNIRSLLERGFSVRSICARVNVGHSVVNRIRKRITDVPSPRAGRPRILDAYDERYCVRLVTSRRRSTAVEIKKNFSDTIGLQQSAQTIRRALRRQGLKAKEKDTKTKAYDKTYKEPSCIS